MADQTSRRVCYMCAGWPRDAHCGICDPDPVKQPEPVAKDGWAEKMLRLIDAGIPDKHKTPGYSIVAVVQDAFNELQTAPVAVAPDLTELREYHVKGVKDLNHYADACGLRESDVKHYRKRAEFHARQVALIDSLK